MKYIQSVFEVDCPSCGSKINSHCSTKNHASVILRYGGLEVKFCQERYNLAKDLNVNKKAKQMSVMQLLDAVIEMTGREDICHIEEGVYTMCLRERIINLIKYEQESNNDHS